MRFLSFPLIVLAVAVVSACTHAADPKTELGARPLSEPLVPFINPSDTVADYLACLRDDDVMIVSAHRGGPTPGYAENGLATIANTLSQAPFLVEVDIRMTADGVFVLLHDEDLSRTTTGEGLIAETTSADLAALQLVDNDGLPTGHPIPTLAEALDWARGRAFLQLDVKSGAPIDAVAAQVVERDAAPFAAVIAYTVEYALRAASVDEDLTVSVEILDTETLDLLETGGLSAERLMAWTGIETERPNLWASLNDRGVSAAWGSLWYLDRQVIENGQTEEFARLAEVGLDVLSSDIHLEAFQAVEKRQDTAAAVARCNAAL
ncbi:MAG: glycerophosphodiester phosphodiesterase family protein [Pseudomonadota bacterium]